MNRAHYIAGDWGTSRVVETRQGPGVGVLREPAATALRALVAGWRQTPYLPCPADLRAPGGAATRFEADGGAALHPELGSGRHLFYLPGLRTLWQP